MSISISGLHSLRGYNAAGQVGLTSGDKDVPDRGFGRARKDGECKKIQGLILYSCRNMSKCSDFGNESSDEYTI